MKKILLLFLVCVLLVSLVGCGGGTANSQQKVSFESFRIESLRLETDKESLVSYAKNALKESKVTYSEEADLVIRLTEDAKLSEKDYALRVDSATSVTVRGGSKAALRSALAAFFDAYVNGEESCVSVGVQMEYKDYSTDTVDSGIPGWTLQWCFTHLVASGVTYEDRVYNDEEAKPHKAYIVYADPGTTTIHYGTSQDGYTDKPTVKQDVLQQVKASVNNGYHVIAATNADFFSISSDYHPTGLAIKNGTKLNSRPVGGDPYLGVTKDGAYFIDTVYLSSDDTSNVLSAISGNYAIVLDGKPFMTAMDTTHGVTGHPRTLSGITADGKLILAVIDGRQAKLSNGADLESAAYFMISLGADRALNHDGGGSSTMVLRTGGNYQITNSPSDGSPRKVFGSIQIVQKTEK